MKRYIAIARPDHWIKNIFMLPGLIFAYMVVGLEGDYKSFILKFFLGIASLCLVASANYVINEYLDAPFDQFHPTKKERVAVRLGLNPAVVYTEYAILIVLGLGLAWFCGTKFFCTSIFLLFMGVLYNVKPIRTKDVPYLDVLSESINNAIRLALGWFLISPSTFPMASITFGYWMGGAFLMGVKRFSEYLFIDDKSLASSYRKSFKYYNEKTLLLSSIFYSMLSLFFIGVFIIKYRIEYVLLVPFVAFLFIWYLWIGMQKDSAAQKPEKLYKQWKLFLFIIFIVALGVVLSFINIPSLYGLEVVKYVAHGK
ncbi:MAG: UbiA family prenyltransferase [Bacillota bacterium]|nr:UbiA family prenyltransferase [Bacillota bacterium]